MALLCHAVALGKKKITSVAVRESGVAPCHGVPPPRSFTCVIFSRGFDYRSSFFPPKPLGNACYAGCGGPSEQCRSVPRGGVEKEKGIGRGPRERCRSVPRGGVK